MLPEVVVVDVEDLQFRHRKNNLAGEDVVRDVEELEGSEVLEFVQLSDLRRKVAEERNKRDIDSNDSKFVVAFYA
ncbi:hypothetical protein D0Y65_033309 [Glycine soja]|uniref:Uncharacterized protein n=1 Tax=Glycine soja TaxID=3848 RepID=A0A445HKG7_GLYSO|nr:hypothetical protein D0Y65_033309 [Glycine soja]